MKQFFKIYSILCLIFVITISGLNAQKTNVSTKPTVKKALWFRVSPPLKDMVQNSSYENKNIENREIENELEHDIIINKINVPDALSAIQRQYSLKASMLIKITDFDGVNNLDGVAPPDTQGDVNENYYMQCVNNHTIIKDKNGNTIMGPFPTSNFWQGSGFDDRNDGDPVILWDEDAQRWIVTQFYIPNSGTQYLLIAVSQSSDPTGSYYQYAFDYDYMPDYPKWAVWPDAYYMGANAFSSSGFEGTYVSAFERDSMIAGSPNARVVTFGPDSKWSVFPADADAFPSRGTPCPFVTDQVSSTSGNMFFYIYNFSVDWDTPSNSSFTNANTLVVESYGLFGNGTQVPQPGTSQRLSTLQSRVMYRPYFRHFDDHDALVVARTVNDGGVAAVRWYEFRNTGSGWSVYQQGTYNLGDGIWRWMPSIAMNSIGDIALGYSVSDEIEKYPSIRCVARYADDPLGVMTTTEAEFYTGSASQTGVDRWGDYSMMSVDPNDDSFWFTTEYTTGSWSWRTRIIHFKLPEKCSAPSQDASNFAASDIEDNQMTISWTRGDGDKVLVVARENAPISQFPTNGTAYTADAQFGNGDRIGENNYVIYNGTGTSLTVTGLTPGTQYYFYVFEYFTADYCYSYSPLEGNATTTGTAPCSYCYSWGTTDNSTSTTRVLFNTIDNSTSKPTDDNGYAYSDYTSISTDLRIGSSYEISVYANTGGNNTTYSAVWIDWNQDCDFDDFGESYLVGTVSNETDGITSNSPFTITVPSNALEGTTTMRVSTKTGSNPSSCESAMDGEVEDYTLNILSETADIKNTNTDFVIFPNPSDGSFTINTKSENEYKLLVSDMTGKIVYSQSLTGRTNKISTELPEGIYTVKIINEKTMFVSKIIIK